MPDLRDLHFDFGEDLKDFLDRHPNLRDFLFGQFPWDEVQPAIPGQAA